MKKKNSSIQNLKNRTIKRNYNKEKKKKQNTYYKKKTHKKMLKGDQFANTVKQDNRISIQVNHLVKPHHPQMVLNSIDPNFVQTIQSKRNASTLYFNKMKLLQADELDRSLFEYQRKKQLTQMQKENERKDYRQRVNGLLGDIEKNMMARSMMFQSQLVKQSQKQSRFIDDYAIKENKLAQLINKNIDPSVFNKESDRYRQYQTLQHSRTLQTMQVQKMQMQKRRQQQKRRKQLQIRQREQYERRLQQQRLRNMEQKMKNRNQYRMDLQKLVDEKRESQMRRPQPAVDYRRHNPITNPIEYHIDNPYILKRLERYNNS